MIPTRTLPVALLAFMLTGPTHSFAETCVTGRDGRQVVEQGKADRFPDAMRRAGLSFNQVLEVQLCPAGAGFVYRVKVLQPGGHVKLVNIPAK